MPTGNKTATTKNATTVAKKKAVKKQRAPVKSTSGSVTAKADAGRQPSTHTLKLDSVAVINNAKTLYEEFSRAVNTDVNIDASAVEMIDTAILQLLYAFVIKVTSTHHKINWINPSEEFVTRARLLGLSRNLGIS